MPYTGPFTANLNLNIPTSGEWNQTPQWGQLLNENFETLDQLVPTADNPLTPDRFNVNADVDFNGWAATHLKMTAYDDQGSALDPTEFLRSLYSAGGELYWNDAAGNDVQITNNGSVNSAAGNIQNLPSTPAGAAISWNNTNNQFDFLGKSGTGAVMAGLAARQLSIAEDSAVYPPSEFISLVAPALPGSYTLTLPDAPPSGSSVVRTPVLTSDTFGAMSWDRPTGLITPTLATGWTSAAGFGFWRGVDNCIHFQGELAAGLTAGTTIVAAGGIAAEYRPLNDRAFLVLAFAGVNDYQRITIRSNGSVVIDDFSAGVSELDVTCISYGAGR